MSKKQKRTESKRRRVPAVGDASSAHQRGSNWAHAITAIIGVGAVVCVVVLAMMQRTEPRTPPTTVDVDSRDTLAARSPSSSPPALERPEARLLVESPREPTDEEKDKALREEQLGEVTRLARRFSDSADAAYLAGLVLHEQGRIEEAMTTWTRCRKLAPNRADVCDSMGRALLYDGQLDRAVEMFRAGLAVQADRIDIRVRLAEALMNHGEFQEVIAVLPPDLRPHPQVYLLLGQAYQQLGEHAKAKEEFSRAVAIQPDLVDAYYGLARSSARLKQAEQAVKYQQKFSELKAQSQQMGRDSRRTYDALELTRRRVSHTLTDAGGICQILGDSREAERLWRRAADVDPNSTRCRRHLAKLLRSAGRVADALQMDQELCHLEPTRAVHFFSAGNMLTMLKRYDLAEQAFQKVIDLESERADGYRALAQLYLVTKKNDQVALSLASKAVSLSPTAPVHALVSLARERNGDRAGALQAVRKAIELEPRNAEYRRRYEKLQQKN